jgi:hypothetical protein
MAEQLTVVTGRPLGGPETTEVRRAGLLALLREAAATAHAAGRGLLVLVDGLDEDAGGSPSIAALLPRNPPEGLHVLVTSRPGHELPHDRIWGTPSVQHSGRPQASRCASVNRASPNHDQCACTHSVQPA